ncbi:PREDICTED: pancreatic lipase-related protein 2-like [Nicrophorus vespilloides]|uniref:Pancreatic lipase-related protein 2-like n=1 Tax=Nicrophorus vespilloides TaxID=110193 RepID=A0ABM1M341_NICVS|nr:PREDICTED: pancreatic lipase-related protein 2-like [Nicrophorus vespilloides]
MLLLLLLVFIGGGDAIARFYLLNRQSPESKTEITDENLHLVNANLTVKFIIHGWLESYERQWYTDMTRAYLLRYDCNVIQVDWKEEAAQLYSVSVQNTKIIGDSVGDFIVKLNKNLGLGLEKVHVVGHSLGGQVSGFAGKEVLRLMGKKIDRISGLDPAGPEFEGKDTTERLYVGDANFVDITHTDRGVFGYKESIGTVDFMPNGGDRRQPGCTLLEHDNQLTLVQDIFCSHIHSYLYFIQSINDKSQIAYKCNNYLNYKINLCSMNEKTIYGEDVDRNAAGTFYFRTTAAAPYFT